MENKIKLTTRDWQFYNLLLSDTSKWWTKQEILEKVEGFNANDTAHDYCACMNSTRIKLNEALFEGQLSHYVLLKDNAFKLAESEEEMQEIVEKMKKQLWKNYLRFLGATKVIKENGQGKLIDCKGNVISEDSLAKRFFEPFNYGDR